MVATANILAAPMRRRGFANRCSGFKSLTQHRNLAIGARKNIPKSRALAAWRTLFGAYRLWHTEAFGNTSEI